MNHQNLRWLTRPIQIVLHVLALWTFGAILFDGPFSPPGGNAPLAVLWLLLWVTVSFRRHPWIGWGILLGVALGPWLAIQPRNDRPWKPEFAQTGWADVQGDQVTLHGFRNFDYSPDGHVTERWESRTVHLSKLQGVDFFLDAFMGEWVAHPIASFDFGEDGHVALSVETRRETHERFSMLGGLYKMYELQYLFGDERDFIRLRTNVHRQPVYLYRMATDPGGARRFFMQAVETLNRLKDHPRYYNVLSQNCTTSYRTQRSSSERGPFDIRLLLNGKLDAMLYERGALQTAGLSFPELRATSLINEAAQAADADPDFSDRLRSDLPAFAPAQP